MGQMPDALPGERKLPESSLIWARYGQIARALLSEERHPYLQSELGEIQNQLLARMHCE